MLQTEVLEALARDFCVSGMRSFVCPHCGGERIIAWAYLSDGNHKEYVECQYCKKTIAIVERFSRIPCVFMNDIYNDVVCPHCDMPLVENNITRGKHICKVCEKLFIIM